MLLAQANIARFHWPLSDPRMADFVAQIDAMNQLAESSDGFVWRFIGDFDSARLPTPFDDPLLFFNMSVWRDVQSLRNYVFHSEHVELMRRKAEWTRPASKSPLALWWLNDDQEMPGVADAIARLAALDSGSDKHGVFTFSDVPSGPED